MRVRAMIYCVLNTGCPTRAFWDIIWGMCTLKSRVPTHDFLWKLSPKEMDFLANLSFREAFDYFETS
jgi:hypothetical protein